jgi:hypothetical protein
MNFRGVNIIIWKGKAYLPNFSEYKSGIIVQIPPVYVANLDVDELQAAIEKILSTERIVLPDPTLEEWKNRRDPILDATKAKSWKELAKRGASYGLVWTEQGIRLDVSRLDKKGRWESDPNKEKTFYPGFPLNDILRIIIEDINTKFQTPE